MQLTHLAMLLTLFEVVTASHGGQSEQPPQQAYTDGEWVYPAQRWLETSTPGFCGLTSEGVTGACTHGSKGSWGLSAHAAKDKLTAAAVCLRRCSRCARCRYITLNIDIRDCSWYYSCPKPDTRWPEYFSGPRFPAIRHVRTAEIAHGDPQVGTNDPTGYELALPSPPPPARTRPSLRADVVLFVHMEKTGGTTVRNFFKPPHWKVANYCAHDPVGWLHQIFELDHADPDHRVTRLAFEPAVVRLVM